jgi:hypothetical protein
MDALETYLRELAAIQPVAVKETSYYPPLSTLFNEIGHGLKPRVRCVIHPSSSGAGLPDGGFFTPDQLRGASDADLISKVPLSRGVIEAKGTGENADAIAKSPQVAKYRGRYEQVLITTLRDFVLLGKNTARKRSRYRPLRATRIRMSCSDSAPVQLISPRVSSDLPLLTEFDSCILLRQSEQCPCAILRTSGIETSWQHVRLGDIPGDEER